MKIYNWYNISSWFGVNEIYIYSNSWTNVRVNVWTHPFVWQEKSREIASLLLCVMVTYICMMTQIEYILLSTIFLLRFWSQSAIHSVNYALCFNISTRKLITPIFNYIMGYLFWFSGPMNNFFLSSYVDSCIWTLE